jgi:aryl-alcohol dehydrogenase-like predicted oxidoreductase
MNEEIIGKAIKKFEIPRHKLTILAKCCGTVSNSRINYRVTEHFPLITN